MCSGGSRGRKIIGINDGVIVVHSTKEVTHVIWEDGTVCGIGRVASGIIIIGAVHAMGGIIDFNQVKITISIIKANEGRLISRMMRASTVQQRKDSDSNIESIPYSTVRIWPRGKGLATGSQDAENNNKEEDVETMPMSGSSDEEDARKEVDFDGFRRRRAPASNKTLDLKLLDQNKLREAFKELHLKHETEKEGLRNSYKALYSQWYAELMSGFNILFYGFGSKKEFMLNFAKNKLKDYPVISVNGYIPATTIKMILTMISEEIFGVRKTFSTLNEHCEFILNFLNDPQKKAKHMFLVIHNIDGEGFRSDRVQTTMALLASNPKIHIVASVDSVTAPYLWTINLNTELRWRWQDVTNFTSYTTELLHQQSVLHGGSTLHANSVDIVLRNLTPNARGIFLVLAEFQLQNPDKPGMSVDLLFDKCRDQFLVSSEISLKSHLVEFKDHHIFNLRRDNTLHIPLHPSSLQQLVDSVKAAS